MILNIAKNYYENNKELLRGRAKNKYRELSEEKNRRENMGETDIIIYLKKKKLKKRLKEYQKNYREAKMLT